MNDQNSQTNPPLFLKSPLIYKGKKFELRAVEMIDKISSQSKKEVIVHPGAVLILPFVDSKTIILIRNKRFAVGQTLWELPAGTLEPKELPLETAKRELIEETGYRCHRIEQLTTFYTTPGFCNEIMHCYVASELKEIGQSLDEGEEIEVHLVSMNKALEMIQNGTIIDAKTIAAILFYQAFKQKIKT